MDNYVLKQNYFDRSAVKVVIEAVIEATLDDVGDKVYTRDFPP